MTATELYKAGKLQEAINAQVQEAKSHPADHAKRLFLFELLAFAGDRERARKHIDAVNCGDLGLGAASIISRAELAVGRTGPYRNGASTRSPGPSAIRLLPAGRARRCT